MDDTSITDFITAFRSNKNIINLIKALFLILRQKRAHELIYGVFCDLAYRPSPIKRGYDNFFLGQIMESAERFICESQFLSRSELVQVFSKDFAVDFLPNDFAGCRREGMVHAKRFLIIGEYGDNSSRVFYITHKTCDIIDFYNHVTGVKHIHLIHRYENPGEFLISTGDSKKLLDLWTIVDGKIRFTKRIKKYIAGYTAAIKVNGKLFLGTDFSNRPNYIETLKGEKYFFPKKAYKQYVVTFYSLLNRYIVSINAEMVPFGGNKTLSIFDVLKEEFLFCDYVNSLDKFFLL